MPHIKYMKVAISLAKIAYQNGDVPVGAVIVDSNGIIIGQGYNSKEVNNNPLEHAEMIAIANAAKTLGQ
jgi:tRNA(adenine34) deaminase